MCGGRPLARAAQGAFNSLFEMRAGAAQDTAPDAQRPLSILYLRCYVLYHMDSRHGYKNLSILYLRCPNGSWRWPLRRLATLSILYLRCTA